jgi:hypothetical protein
MSRRGRVALLVIVLTALVIHGRNLGYPFVGDDDWQIGRLPAKPGATLFVRAWTMDHWGGDRTGLYRPLLHTLWLGEATVSGGLRAPVVRAGNLALLVTTAALFARFLRRMGVGHLSALAAALVTVVHPASVEVVNRGVGQGELITALLTVVCLMLTHRLTQTDRAGAIIGLIAALFLVGTLTKETMWAAALACLALLLVECPRPVRRLSALAVALAAAGAVTLTLRLVVLKGRVNPVPEHLALGEMHGWEHITTALGLLTLYLRDAAVPHLPAVDYHHLAALFPPAPTLWVPGLLIVVIAAAAMLLIAPRHRRAPVALIWAAGSVGLVLHLVPMGSVYASRHLWPVLFPLSWGAAWVLSQISRGRPHLAPWAAGVTALWLLTLGAYSFTHVGEHRDGVTLWRAASVRHRDNPVAHQNLAFHLIRAATEGEELEGDSDSAALRAEARRHLEIALALERDLVAAWATLGRLELDERNQDEAETALIEALLRDPDHTHALFDLGVLRTTRSDWAGARQCWERVVTLEPLYPRAALFLAMLPQEGGSGQGP